MSFLNVNSQEDGVDVTFQQINVVVFNYNSTVVGLCSAVESGIIRWQIDKTASIALFFFMIENKNARF